MKSGSDVAQWVSPVPPRWQLPDVRAGDLLSAGATQLTEHLAHDPLLKSIEQVWNANPLRDVIPLDCRRAARPDRGPLACRRSHRVRT
jgi:polyhydroxyalkanoate synthase